MDVSEMLNQILSTDEGKEGMEQLSKMMENGDLDLSALGAMFGNSESSESADKTDTPHEESKSENKSGGIDMEMMMKFAEIIGKMNTPDDNSKLLIALKPLLRSENQTKIDTALKFMKIAAVLPYLKEGGLFENLF